MPGKAIQWGADIINGIVDGIRSAFGNLVSAVSDIASTISSYIHFSVPDVGPLADADEYMPDFIDLLVKGINSGMPRLERAMQGMTSSMLPGYGASTTGSQTASGNMTANNNISINVYGAQGQDVSELADIIEQRIADNTVRRGVAFG